MKKGKLEKQSGNWVLKYKKSENSPKTITINVPHDFCLDDEAEDQEVAFDNTGGTLNSITFNNRLYTRQNDEQLMIEENPPEIPQIEAPEGYGIAIITDKNNRGIEIKKPDRPAKFLRLNLFNQEAIREVDVGDTVFVRTNAAVNFYHSILFEDLELLIERAADPIRPNQPQARQPAQAPYNFVPLNDAVVEALIQYKDENGKIGIPPFDRFVEGHHSGYIDLKIEAKTKVFIGSGSSKTGNYKFFAPNGTPRIPGSSLRGMVRTMVEICSWGQFKFFENTQLFYRTFENSSMGIEFYRERMVGKHGQPKLRAGYLKKEGRSYKIIPALCDSSVCDTEFYRIDYSVVRTIFPYLNPFEEKTVFFQPEQVVDQSDRHSRRLDYALLTSVSNDYDKIYFPIEGKLIASGNMPGNHGKHMHWVINMPNKSNPSKYNEVSKDVINTYKEDANRKIRSFDLLSRLNLNPQKEVTCFYLEENGEITAIGHTPYFRLPYKNKIGDLLPQAHKDFNGIDIPTAIFGNESTDDEDAGFAGRVFFEDAVCKSNCNNREATTHRGQATAISPKPTSFQLYLKQDSIDVDKEDLKHYDSKDENENHAELRGNKLYWHKKPDPHRNNTDKLQFNNTRIRFTNLNDVELGALLFALDLPESYCHKIGMGKPQGLGSIRITPTLYIEDHQIKYASFSAAMHYKSEPEEDISSFKETFENYIKEHPGIDNSLPSLWERNRLKQLKALLNYDTPPRNTGYMPFMVPTGRFKPNGKPIEEFNPQFKERLILPDADKVK